MTRYDFFISSATFRIAWSRPRPASTQTTIKSSASGRPEDRFFAASAEEPHDQCRADRTAAGEQTIVHQRALVSCRAAAACRRPATAPIIKLTNFEAEKHAPARFAAEAGMRQLQLELAGFCSVLGLQRLGKARGGCLEHFRASHRRCLPCFSSRVCGNGGSLNSSKRCSARGCSEWRPIPAAKRTPAARRRAPKTMQGIGTNARSSQSAMRVRISEPRV